MKAQPENICIQLLEAGDVFYSDKPDRHLTALANQYGAKIKTKRFILVHPVTLEAKKVTQVTIVSPALKNTTKFILK
jgi:hypothetical protein